jgi:hypothetical protein
MFYLQRIKKSYRKSAAELVLFIILIEDVNKAFWTKEPKIEAKLYNKISEKFYNYYCFL